jgi:siderophore synthetase component
VLQNHLGEIIFALASHFDVPESVFWEEVRQVIEEMLERVEAPWLTAPFLRTKALLTMRFKKTAQDYLYTDFPNPLLGRGEGNRGEN